MVLHQHQIRFLQVVMIGIIERTNTLIVAFENYTLFFLGNGVTPGLVITEVVPFSPFQLFPREEEDLWDWLIPGLGLRHQGQIFGVLQPPTEGEMLAQRASP